MGNEIEPFDVDQFFTENARRRNRANLAERLADWISDYGERAPWDEPDNGDGSGSKTAKAKFSFAKRKSKPDEKPLKSDNTSANVQTIREAADQERSFYDQDRKHLNNDDNDQDRFFASSLYRLLDESGSSIAARRADLKKGGATVLEALNDRADADITQVANMFRVWIGVFWGGAAAWLYVQFTNAKIAGAEPTAAGIPVNEATVMASIFALLGGLAAFSGMATLGIGAARKSFSNEDFIRASENYGSWIAKTLEDFDNRLHSHRRKLADKALSNEEVLREVSEAHLTAEEAAVLFNEVGFLVEGDAEPRQGALRAFKEYLNGCGLISPATAKSGILAGGILGLLGGTVLGSVFGVLIVIELLSIAPGVVLDKLGVQTLQGFDKYPLALMAIILPACLLVMAGGIGELLAASFMNSARNLRIRDSLQAIRSSITAAQAPRARDIAQRVEDLSEIFRVRLAKVGTESRHSATPETEAPSWRNRDDSPRFVDAGFASAPKPFLADTANSQNAKKFSPVREAKRGLFGLGKPRRS